MSNQNTRVVPVKEGYGPEIRLKNFLDFITYVQRLSNIEKDQAVNSEIGGLSLQMKFFNLALKESVGMELSIMLITFPLFIFLNSDIIQTHNNIEKFKVLAGAYLLGFGLQLTYFIFLLWLVKKYAIGKLTRSIILTYMLGKILGYAIKIIAITILAFGLKFLLHNPEVLKFLYKTLQHKISINTFIEGVIKLRSNITPNTYTAIGIITTLGITPTIYLSLLAKQNKKEKIKSQKLKIVENGTFIGTGYKINDPYTKIEELIIEDRERNTHTGIIGTTGTGKTKLLQTMIEQDIKRGWDVIVIDPKGDTDLLVHIYKTCKETNRLENLMIVSPFKKNTNKINPLAKHFIPEELVFHITAPITSGEQFFQNIAKEFASIVINGILLMMEHEVTLRKALTLNTIANYCSYDGLAKLKHQIEKYLEIQDPKISEKVYRMVSSMKQILDSPPDYFNKVGGNLRTILTVLTTGSYAEFIAYNEENEFLERLEKGKGVVMYIETGSMLEKNMSEHLARIIGAMIQTSAGRMNARNERYKRPVALYIDEAYRGIYLGIENLFDKGRSVGLHITVSFQSISQFKEVVGPNLTQTILDNINNWIIFRIPSPDTSQYFEKLSGQELKYLATYQLTGDIGGVARPGYALETKDFESLPNRHFYLMRLSKGKVIYEGITPEIKELSHEEKVKILKEIEEFLETTAKAKVNGKVVDRNGYEESFTESQYASKT